MKYIVKTIKRKFFKTNKSCVTSYKLQVTCLGFTFIEMIVVIAVIAITLPVLFTIIFAITKQQLKIYRLSEVKRQGDYALNIIENSIRGKAALISADLTPEPTHQLCLTPAANPTPILTGYFFDKNNTYFKFSSTTNLIKQNFSGTISNLSNNKTRVENFNMSCVRSSPYSPPLINISFDICYNNNVSCSTLMSRPEENASLQYKTSVKLRSY